MSSAEDRYKAKAHRDRRLDLLALGYDCKRCGATADEPCRSTSGSGKEVDPHLTRINRAVLMYRKQMRQLRGEE